STYLLMFHYFGYDFARRPIYQKLREQVLNPNDRIWDGEIVELEESRFWADQGSVLFVLEPAPAILAVLRYQSAESPLYLGVVLPGADGDVPPRLLGLGMKAAVESCQP